MDENDSTVQDPGEGGIPVVATVDYAKSFHLRFAGNSTVRKKRRPKLRQRREDESEETSSDEEFDDYEDEDDEVEGVSQEPSVKLSQRELNNNSLRIGTLASH